MDNTDKLNLCAKDPEVLESSSITRPQSERLISWDVVLCHRNSFTELTCCAHTHRRRNFSTQCQVISHKSWVLRYPG